MKDILIVALSFATAIGLFYLRVKYAGGWWLLPKRKIQTLFGRDKTHSE